MQRGIVRIKRVFVGISHYRKVYGSVCSADVKGTPPVPAQSDTELCKRAGEPMTLLNTDPSAFGHWLEALEEAATLLGIETRHLQTAHSRRTPKHMR